MATLTLVLAIGSGIIGGAFYAFSSFIMRALRNLPSDQGIAAMQRINIDVINPWFMIPFVGTALVGLGGAVWALLAWNQPGAPWLFAGGLLYLFGTFGVTMVFNVPRNNALALASPTTSEGATLWADYLHTWTMWNSVRTIAALASMGSAVIAYRLISKA